MTAGIYDGFEGYRTPSKARRAQAVSSWLIVLDANVLLDLYGLQGKALEESTSLFDAIGHRLFVPHQVMDEFWRNRRQKLVENEAKFREFESVKSGLAGAEQAFKEWHQRVVDRKGAPDPSVLQAFADARKAVVQVMEAQSEKVQFVGPDTPTHEDALLHQLEILLQGRIGAAPSAWEHELLVREGLARLEDKTPPGYMDKDKKGARAVGDYLVWVQMMAAALEHRMSVVFVTNDLKEDWWADPGKATMRARPELVAEMFAQTGQQLMLMRFRDLLAYGGQLGVTISNSTVDEAQLASTWPAHEPGTGWDLDLATSYLYYLLYWQSHYEVFLRALDAGGTISRQEMAQILKKDPQGPMKGAGKPFVTAARRVAEERDLDVDLPTPLVAVYDPWGWMSEFAMPPDLVAIFRAAVDQLSRAAE